MQPERAAFHSAARNGLPVLIATIKSLIDDAARARWLLLDGPGQPGQFGVLLSHHTALTDAFHHIVRGQSCTLSNALDQINTRLLLRSCRIDPPGNGTGHRRRYGSRTCTNHRQGTTNTGPKNGPGSGTF